MKPLTSTQDAIDAWAHQDRPEGAAGNVRFDGPRLFSYSTPVAAIVSRAGLDGPHKLCLTIYRRFSASTSGHVAHARSAAGQAGYASIAVATIDMPMDHQRNLLGIAEDAMAHLRKAQRAHQHKEGRLMHARKRLLEANLYAKFFDLPFYVHVNDENMIERVENFIGQLQSTEVA